MDELGKILSETAYDIQKKRDRAKALEAEAKWLQAEAKRMRTEADEIERLSELARQNA